MTHIVKTTFLIFNNFCVQNYKNNCIKDIHSSYFLFFYAFPKATKTYSKFVSIIFNALNFSVLQMEH